MGRKPRMISKATLIQVPPKRLCHQDKSILLPYSPPWLASLSVGDHSPQADQVTHLKNQSRTKLLQFPSHRTTSTRLPYHYKQATAAPLPYLDHQNTTKPSSGYKYQSKATVLPLLCPEYKSKTTAVTLPSKDKCLVPPMIHNELFEAFLDSSHRTEIPSSIDRLPKMPQIWSHQTGEELSHLKRRSTTASLTDQRRVELPVRPYSQDRNIAAPLECISHQIKTVMKSSSMSGPPNPRSQSSSQQRTAMSTLPCLNQGPKATTKKNSGLNLPGKTLAPKLFDPDLHCKFLTSLPYTDHISREKTALSLHNNHCAKATSVLTSPNSQCYFVWSPLLYLKGRAIAKTSGTKLQATPQTAHRHPERGTGDCPPCSDHWDEATFVPLSCHANPSWASKDTDYVSKEISTPSSHSDDLRPIPPPCSNHCAEVPSSLNQQDINSSGDTPRMVVLKEDNFWATPQTVSCKQAEVTSAPSLDNKISLYCNYKETTRPVSEHVSIRIPSGPDHHLGSSWCLAKQSTNGLVLNNCTNIPLGLSHCPLIPLDKNQPAETKLTHDDRNKPPVPDHLTKAVLDTNPKAISSVNLDQMTINSGGLHSQAVPLHQTHQTPTALDHIHRVRILPSPLHQATTLPGSHHCAKDIPEIKVQDTHQSLLDYCEKVFPQHRQKTTTPKVYNNQETTQSGTTQPNNLSHYVTSLDIPDQLTEVTGNPKNTQGSYITTSECQLKPSQGAKCCFIPLLESGLDSSTLTTSYYDPLAQVEQSSDLYSETQSGLQHQLQTVQNTTWRLNYIKPHTVEGGTVPIKIVNDIITSIPQEKIKNDLCRQIILRRMQNSTYRFTQPLSCSYKACLTCASWIPKGCLHDNEMNYSSRAQLLAIPMPVPGCSGEMGVKFVLQILQSKTGSISNDDYPNSYNLSPLCYSSYLPSSQSGTIPAKSSILLPPREWVNLMFTSNDYQQWARKTSSSPTFRQKMPMKTNTTCKESKNYGRFVKSLLYKMQKKGGN